MEKTLPQNNSIQSDSTQTESIQMEDHWKSVLLSEFKKDYMRELKSFLLKEYSAKKIIYPKASHFFKAFNLTPFDKVKVVILGQDPYHNPGQAHGLCFSVQPEIPIPPSLQNIFKEIQDDLELPTPTHGCLMAWAEEGVLLLNATLSVEKGKAGSHQNRGWERFTDQAIRALNDKCENLVFLLWGSFAQSKAQFIDGISHLILKAPHPSPLSAHRGFFGCKHFSKTNDYLKRHNKSPINWKLD